VSTTWGDTVSRVRIRPRSSEDDAQIVQIYSAISPDLPRMTVEELRFYLDIQPEEAHAERQVAEVDGKVVAICRWNRLVFIEDQDTWVCDVGVGPAFRHRGIGGELFSHLLRRVIERSAKRLKCHVREDQEDGKAFAASRGFVPTGHGERLSRLEVRSARLDRCRAADERVRREDIRIATLSDLGPDDEGVLHAIYELDNETTRDVPGSDVWTSMSFEFWRKYLHAPGMSPDHFWIALDGERPVGMAVLDLRGARSAFNGYTGVDREYRGKGIARALKLRTVAWARQNGIDFIYTGNDAQNKPMLAINVEMGYEPLPAEIEMVKQL